MGKLTALLALFQALGPLVAEGWPHILALIDLLKRVPHTAPAVVSQVRAKIGKTPAERLEIAHQGRPERVDEAQAQELLRLATQYDLADELKLHLPELKRLPAPKGGSDPDEVSAAARQGAKELKPEEDEVEKPAPPKKKK